MKRVFFSALLVTLLVSVGAYFYYSLPDVADLKRRNPKVTAMMEVRDREYAKKNIRLARQQIWVGYDAISDHLKKAVLLSEDAAFFSHKGVDVNELRAALKRDWESMSFTRGGSTITMQLAKNLYLTPSKNPLRKIKEIVIAHQLEAALSKRRIFEIYLNVAEWGPNVYGIEAAARHYFGKSAAMLDPVEAATLAALLPSPRRAQDRSIVNRRNLILSRLASVGHLSQEALENGRRTPLYQKIEQSLPELPVAD
jgi:monofunctional glycosyltransferase